MTAATSSDAAGGPSTGRRRWPWILLGGLALLILLAALVVPALLDVERYRGRIEQALRESTGWEPELGRMDFSVLRGMVLTVKPARLTAPDGSSNLAIEALEVKADLRPLLEGRLAVRRIELLGPRIELVRQSVEQGWIVPELAAGADSGGDRAAADSPLEVSIDEVEIRDGVLLLDDRATEPPRSLELRDLQVRVSPRESSISGSGALADGGGRFSAEGTFDRGLRVDLDGLTTDALQGFVERGLIAPGGLLSGSIEVRPPLELSGRLTARRILLLEGDRPLESAQLEFSVLPDEGGWRLQSLDVESGGVRMTGQGSLSPDLSLRFEIPVAPLDSVVLAARSVFPVPLQLESPGTAEATIRLTQPAGGTLSTRAQGEITAAGFVAADFLPAARDVRAAFELDPQGRLEIRILDGTVAGGPLEGLATLDSVSSPGSLIFDGELLDGGLGQMLEGFVPQAGKRISGPAGLKARMRLDLTRETLDARALSGGLGFAARDVDLPGWDLQAAIRDRIQEKLGGLAAAASALDGGLADKLGRLGLAPGTQPDSPASKVERLLKQLSADVDFDRLPWTLQRLELAAGGLTATGRGTFDPLQGAVDVSFTATLDAEQTADLLGRYPALDVLLGPQKRLTLPLKIGGALMAPEIGVDLGSVTRNKLGVDKPEDAVKGLIEGLIRKRRTKDEPKQDPPANDEPKKDDDPDPPPGITRTGS